MRTGIVSNSTLCLPLLHHLKAQQESITVFSGEQAMPGTGSISSYCAGAGITCTSANGNGDALYDWVTQQQPDLVFIIGHSQKIETKRFIVKKPDFFNVHFGHLPEYRGPNPVFWQLKKGMPSLAISIHCISERMDAGAIAWKKEYANQPFFSYGYVHQLMSHYLVEGVNHLLQLKKRGQPILTTPQDDRKKAYYERPSMKDVCINWSTMGAAEIGHLVNACNPWNSGAITSYNGFEVRISDVESLQDSSRFENEEKMSADNAAAGTIIGNTNALYVACFNKEIIRIHTLTVNGILMPARFAANYGFLKGQLFKNI